jgi:hypothetical protein
MVRGPTETSKAPSSLMRMASGGSPRFLRAEFLGYGDLRVGNFLLAAPSYRERAMFFRLVTAYDAITVASNAYGCIPQRRIFAVATCEEG